MPTAILIDGGFFLRRYRHLRGHATPSEVAKELHRMCLEHLKQADGRRQLYRIFYYDCPPLTKKVHNPVSHQAIDFAKSDLAIWRTEFHEALKSQRKVALRMGVINEASGHWALKPTKLKELLRGSLQLTDLTAADVTYEAHQKGVDMRIGLDIASMTFKKQVDQIILVSGDSDFVPAAKLARREGVDFILDPMWAQIRADLNEHVDGIKCVFPKSPSPSLGDLSTGE